jgi:predicted enzyme related to lactoylglutathione lyase
MQIGIVRGLVVDTDDIEHEVETMQANGIEPGPIEKKPWGRFASVTDPDGNVFTLHQ